MQTTLLYAMAGLALFALGLHALIARHNLLKKILAVNIMSSGVFLVFIANNAQNGALIDPVSQALVLTGIVVAVSATALALVLACSIAAAVDREESTTVEKTRPEGKK